MTIAAGWHAEIRLVRQGGVVLVVGRDGCGQAEVWFPTPAAALVDPRARQFAWRESRAIGSPTLYRGDLGPWID